MRPLPAVLVALSAIFLVRPALAQERTIRGVVTDSATRAPVDGVQVVIQGTGTGTVGDDGGRFVLTDVPAEPVTLVFRRIGFRTREVEVPTDVERVEVGLARDYLRLDEVVVTGRATTVQRRNLANSVATVGGDQLTRVPQQTIDGALQGRIAGGIVSANSGAPGGGLQIELRGTTTINAEESPLFVIDGVLISNAAIQNGQREIGGAGDPEQDQPVNRIADINPNDIESIEVLKGASAAAIYGSKAAAGVVIITTKRGRQGDVDVRLDLRGGFFDLSNTLDFRVFGSAEEAGEVFGNVGAEIFAENGGRVFDNQQALAGRNTPSWEVAGSVSGGSETTRYFGSANWRDDEGIIRNTGFERQSARLNLTQELGAIATLNLNTYVYHSLTSRALTGNDNRNVSPYIVLAATPTFFDLSPRPDGSFPRNPFIGNGSNPLQTTALMDVDQDVFRFVAGGNLDLEAVRSGDHTLRFVVAGGADFFDQEDRLFSPPELFFEPFDGLVGTSLLNTGDNLNANTNVSAVHRFEPGTFTSTFSVGAQYERRDLRTRRVISENLTGGNQGLDAGTKIRVQDARAKEEDFGFYAQEEVLALDDRLLVTGSVRFDQSSTNGDDDKLFAYPKAALSYRIPDLGGLADEVKLRAAFGQSGNQPNFGQEFTSLVLSENIQGLPGFRIEGGVGGDLRPERQTEVEGGIDVTALDGRASLELTGFYQRITDLILERQLPPSSGFSRRFFNGGTMENRGVEVVLGLTPVASPDFTWVSRTLFTHNESTITELPVPSFVAQGFGCSLGCFLIEEGESATQIVGSAGEGLTRLGDSNPDFTMSFSNDLEFANFHLFSLLDWRSGHHVVNLTELIVDASQNTGDFVDPDGEVSPVDECFPDCSGLERLLGFVNGFVRGYVQSASFLKVREVSLSYSVPRGTLERLFGGAFEELRLTASGRNLFTVTSYRGLDPEVSQFGNQQVGRSIDVAPFPPSRSIWFSASMTF